RLTLVTRVRKSGGLARASFDDDVEAELLQRRDDRRNNRDTPFAWKRFSRDAESHGHFFFGASAVVSHCVTADLTAGEMLAPASVGYSSPSPVVAGTSRWLIPGMTTFVVAVGGSFFRWRLRVSSPSA